MSGLETACVLALSLLFAAEVAWGLTLAWLGYAADRERSDRDG